MTPGVVKAAMAIVAIALLLCERRLSSRAARWSWVLLAALSVLAYYRFSPAALVQRTDNYDLVHYYLNAKYFPELGYTRLYQACVVADGEGARQMRDLRAMRSLGDQKVQRRDYIAQVRAHPERVKGRFSPQRWRDFSRDLRALQADVDVSRVVLDRGYNATPTWHLVGHALASMVSTRYLPVLCRVDLMLVAAMFLTIGWVYGLRVALIGLVWFCLSFSTTWPKVGWAMLRYDWLAASVAGTCLLGVGHRRLGGALLGWATLSRIFPAILLLFLVVRAAHRLVVHRELDRNALRIAAGFLLVVVAGTALTWTVLGSRQYVDFGRDLAIQIDNLSVNRMGLGVALAYRGETSKEDFSPQRRRQRFEDGHRLEPIGRWIGLALLALAALSLRGRGGERSASNDDDLTQLGFVAFALLLTASFYYWALRLLAVTLHARHGPGSSWNRGALIGLFAIEAWTHGWRLALHFHYGAVATTSIWISIYAATVCLFRWREGARITTSGDGRGAGVVH